MNPIQDIMQTTMSEIKNMIDVNTVVGQAVQTPDGSTVIPVSKVSLGFMSGGGEYSLKNSEGRNPFGGGGGAGITIKPVAFVIVSGGNCKVVEVENNNMLGAVVEKIPGLINEIKNMVNMTGK